MQVLVTGGHGFIGRHLVERLLERGESVRVLFRGAGTPSVLAGLEVDVAHGDLRDAAALRRAVAGVDAIYHLAGLTRAVSRATMFDVNAGGTARLLAAARGSGRSPRFVYCSSTAARGPSPTPILRPGVAPGPALSWYGASKARAEDLIAAHAAGLPWVILRPTAVYGPGDRDFLTLFQSVARGLALVPGAPGATYSLVHAHDLAEALVVAAASPTTTGRTYAVAHAQTATMEQILAAAEAAIGRRTRRLTLPASALRLVGRSADLLSQCTGRASLLGTQRVVEVAARHWVCDPAPLTRDTGWEATRGLLEGFASTVAWYRAERLLPPPRGGR
jgi:nucleoside-diphosphate-sugar epimerase